MNDSHQPPPSTPRPEDETQVYDPDSGPTTGRMSVLLKAGHKVGKCRIVGPLGQGGMGIVYSAHHETLDLPVAIKLLSYVGPPDGLPAFQDRFQREAKVAARLTHQNLVGCKDFGWQDGVGFYLVMELVDGQSLEELLVEGGPLPERRALELAAGAADGLGLAHASSVIHRDIKPANLLIARDGTLKVADLGLARDIEGHGTTRTGQVLGTPAYMAPEQATDASQVGPATDIYALGVTLFQALTGRLPFEGGTTMEILFKHVHNPPPDPREHGIDLSPATTALLEEMLAKDPHDRPADGSETAARIRQALAELDGHAGGGGAGSGRTGGTLARGATAGGTLASSKLANTNSGAAADSAAHEPARRRRTHGRGLLVILVLLGTLALVKFLLPGTPQQGAADFLNLLSRDRIELAYQRAAGELRGSLELAEFTTAVHDSGLDLPGRVKWQEVQKGNNTAQLTGEFERKDGGNSRLTVHLSLERRAWRVASFEVEALPTGDEPGEGEPVSGRDSEGTADPEPQDPEPPPPTDHDRTRQEEAELSAAVEKVLRTFRQALTDRDFTRFHGLLAERWKNNSDPTKLRDHFERKMRTGRRPRSLPKWSAPETRSKPRPGGGKIVTVKYSTRTGPVRIEIQLVYEHGQWKVAGFEPPTR